MAKRQCQGKTAKGKPCQAASLTGSDHCRAHDPLRPAETRFGGSQQAAEAGAKGGAAGRHPRAVDVLRTRVEADIDAVLAPYFDALKDLEAETRMKAADRLLDRAYGKARQSVEHTGPDGGHLRVDLSLDEAGREALANVLRQRPAAGR